MAALTRRLPMALLALTLGFTSSAALAEDDHHHHRKSNNIVERLINTKGAEALVAAVLYVDAEAGLDFSVLETLSNEHAHFTVFAPNNQAFEELLGLEPGTTKGLPAAKIAELLPGIVEGLGLDAKAVAGILLNHVADRKKTENRLLKRGKVSVFDLMNEEITLPVGIGAAGVAVNHTSNIIKANVWTSNGLIHFIDTVIVATVPGT